MKSNGITGKLNKKAIATRRSDIQMIIRKLNPADLKQVMEIWLAENLSAHSFISRKYWINHQVMVREALLDADVLVAVDGSTILGFAGLQDNYLAGIFVRTEYHNQGIGTQLLRYVKESYPSFTLSVYVKNHQAIQFYQRQGLEIVQRQVDETGNAEYEMKWHQ